MHVKTTMFPMNTAGSLQLDLTSLIKPATSARFCKLPGGTSPEPTVDLFRQKRCYGWWAMSSMKSGTLKSTVWFLLKELRHGLLILKRLSYIVQVRHP